MTTAAMHTPFVADFVPIVATTPPLPPGTQQARVGPEQIETYPFIFRKMIMTRIRRSVEAVRTAPFILPDDVRDQALHILSFALKEEMCDFEAAWQQSRSLLFELAPRMEQMGHRYDWIPVLEEGIERSLQRRDLSSAAECQLQLGILYRMVSEFERARDQLQASVENFVLIEDKRGQARALNELAWIEQLVHEHNNATNHVNEALRLLDEGDVERGMCYRVLGILAINQKAWDQAVVLNQQALAIFMQNNDKRKSAWGMQNLAYALRFQQKYEEAIQLLESAKETLKEISDIHHWAIAQFNLGVTYYYYGNHLSALACHQEAIPIFRSLNNRIYLARIHTDIGLAYFSIGDYVEAEQAFQHSVDLFKDLNDLEWQLNAVDGLAMTYLATKKYVIAQKLLEDALISLHIIVDRPNYAYLFTSLTAHLQEAILNQEPIM